jgi:hypothetical protein
MRTMGDFIRLTERAHTLVLRRAEGASRRTLRRGSPIHTLAALAATAFISAHATSAYASSCSREVVAQIRFPARQACWTYRGPATQFVGKFSNGQAISTQMTGEAADYDPRNGSTTMYQRPRDPNVEGPGGYFNGDSDGPGVLTFRAPATGIYRFSFSPCAMWGAPGVVKICAH